MADDTESHLRISIVCIEFVAASIDIYGALINTGVDVQPSDKLLTLSTCSHEFDNARLVVVARMVREGERAEVDTSNVTLNTSARYPQVYYDKKKISNPYVGAACWTVG